MEEKNPSEYGYRFVRCSKLLRARGETNNLASEWFKTQDKKLRDQLIVGCRGIVGAVQSNFRPRPPLQRRDLIGAGFKGLAEAADSYNGESDFVNYAFRVVRTNMLDAVKRYSFQIKIPRLIFKEALEIPLEEAQYRRGLSRSENIRIQARRLMSAEFYPFDIGSHDSAKESDLAKLMEDAERRELLQRSLCYLEPRERRVIEGRYLEGKTLKELGREEKLSKERIRGIANTALGHIREYIEIHEG